MNLAAEFECRVIRFPRTGGFAVLDLFVMDELTVPLSCARGSLALHLAGIRWIGELIACSEADLRAVPGIGPKRLSLIKEYLAVRGLELNKPNGDCIAYRKLRPLPGGHRPFSARKPI